MADTLYRQCDWFFDSLTALATGESIPIEKLHFNIEHILPQLRKVDDVGELVGATSSYATLIVHSLWELFTQTGRYISLHSCIS
jgi:hypothetical protein